MAERDDLGPYSLRASEGLHRPNDPARAPLTRRASEGLYQPTDPVERTTNPTRQ
jgi:hypothetical protein